MMMFSVEAFGKNSTCLDALLIASTAVREHIQTKEIDANLMERVIPVYLDIQDPLKIYLLESEREEQYKAAASKKEQILKEIKENTCAFFASLDEVIEKGQVRWVKINEELLEKTQEQVLAYETIDRGDKVEPFKTEEEIKKYAHYIVGKYMKAEMESKKKPSYKKVLTDYKKTLKENTVESEKEKKRGDRVAKSLFLSMDPHSSYMNQEEFEDFEIAISGNFFGVGLQLKETELGVEITKVLKNSPAEKEGYIKKGDIITKVDGNAVLKKKVGDVAKLIRGKQFTKVKVTIVREENKKSISKEVVLTRDLIPLEETKAKGKAFEINGKRIALINLPSFYYDPKTQEGATSDILKVYNEIKSKGKIDAVVLDLRYDGGGVLDEAVKLVGIFIREPVVVQIKSRGEVRKLRANTAPQYISEPLIVAVNKYSASASEIVAGAIKDYGRGIIVGDTSTYGKGTVQSVNPKFRSMNLGAYKVTSAQFYTPDGASTQLKGVTSQIVIPSPSESRDIGEKNQRYAVEYNEVDSIFAKKNKSYFDDYLKDLQNLSKKRVSSNEGFKAFSNPEEMEKAIKKLREEEDGENPYNFDPKKDIVLQEILNISLDLVGFLKAP